MGHPNIIYILADDMGYGDIRGLNPDCAWPTPHLDALGQDGMTFSDAHSSSAVCTPSRYSIMTGRYCWRTWMKQGVLGGVSGPLVEPGRLTVASLLGKAGYRTACIGKWHLGWDWAVKPGCEHQVDRQNWKGADQSWIDFHQAITGGPCDVGFDHFYGIAGSLDMPPYVYVEDRMPVEEPTAWGTSKEFLRGGPRMASLRAHNVLETITDKAVAYIGEQSAETPFFLYLPLTAPHTPISPAPDFIGASGISPYGDFCMEVDHRVGQICAAVAAAGLSKDTIIVFTSDNGASANQIDAGELERRYHHRSSHIYRGYKSDIWDGGHRIPFLVRWPATVSPGSRCDQAVGIFDLFATAAELTGQQVPADAGEDAWSLLPALRGEPIPDNADRALIHHSIDGMFAIRQGEWKLCRCPGSGGWTLRDSVARDQGLPELQLYHLGEDPCEQHNRQATEADRITALTATLHQAVVNGRTTTGPALATADLEGWQQLVWLPEIPERFVIDD